jgi:hypothetical protein
MIGDRTVPSREMSRKNKIVLAIGVLVILVICFNELVYYVEVKDYRLEPIFAYDGTPSEGLSEIDWSLYFNAPRKLKVTWESNYELTASLNWRLDDSIEWEASRKDGFEIVRINDEDVGGKMYPTVNWDFPQGSDGKYITFKLTINGYIVQ